MDKFDYGRAEADLDDMGCRHSDEIYEMRTEKAIKEFMSEYDLKASDYYKPENNGRSTGSSNSSGNGCYLTTACVKAKDLSDDCEELTVLREYRDTYLKNREGGAADIACYYKTAPKIVEKINKLPDAEEIWQGLYETLVVPCVRLIKAGEMEKAYELYRNCTMKSDGEYLS